jgi:DNA-binding Xre family transcriptional regulator
MMNTIRIAVREIAEEIGIKTPTQLCEKTGINYGTCYDLWEARVKRLDLKTLSKLCEKLEASPNELLGYSDSDDREKRKSHVEKC